MSPVRSFLLNPQPQSNHEKNIRNTPGCGSPDHSRSPRSSQTLQAKEPWETEEAKCSGTYWAGPYGTKCAAAEAPANAEQSLERS